LLGRIHSSEDIGYAKIDGKWGIALRSVSGNVVEDEERIENWLFNDAPRSLRLSAIEKIPELLQKLGEASVETTNKIKSKLVEAQAVAAAVRVAANPPKPIGKRIISNVVPPKPVGDAWGAK
jgi:hypothetical protein